MKRIDLKNIITRKSIFQALIFCVSAFILIYFFPREQKFNYRFDEGKPWRYGLLTAPFDIPIYKSSNQLQLEHDSVTRNFQPYYTLNNDIAQQKLESFVKAFKGKNSSDTPASLYKKLSVQLAETYSQGVISTDEYNKLKNSNTLTIKLLQDNMSHIVPISSLLTTRQAYENIAKSLAGSSQKHLLPHFNLNTYLVENVTYDSLTTHKIEEEMLRRVSSTIGLVQAGERIVDKGEIVTPHTYLVLKSFENIATKKLQAGLRQTQVILIGQAIMVVFVLILLFLFLYLFRNTMFNDIRTLIFVCLLVVSIVIAAFMVVRYNNMYIYVVPFALVPIIASTFLDSRVALYMHISVIVLSAFVAPFNFEFICLQLLAGMIAIDTMRDLVNRSQLVRCAIFVLLAYVVAYLGYVLLSGGGWNSINPYMFIYLAISSTALLFAYLLIYLLEKIFGFISNVTLIELSDINSPLLRQLSEECPGTFQHSLQVSNLAVEAANRIGAKALLVRTGALYHDIGKLSNPAFFTENQSGVNPHNKLAFEDSAAIIIQHVKDGTKRAEKYMLPQALKDFIETHHGESKTKYFYNSYVNSNPDKEVDESLFTYPGPIPSTKETAILMMADAVEAASRSLKEYTEESITKLVNAIIDSQIADGQFKLSPISFSDVEQVKLVFIEKLKTIYHTRISYPELIKKPTKE